MATRRKSTQENPIEAFEARTFACRRWPFLSLGGGVKFNRGILVADDANKLERVLKNEQLGRAIIEVKQKSGGKKSVEESAEDIALKELGLSFEPQARRGAVSTTNMG